MNPIPIHDPRDRRAPRRTMATRPTESARVAWRRLLHEAAGLAVAVLVFAFALWVTR